MNEHEYKVKVTREWVEKAENDFANAVNTLKMWKENALRIRFVSMPNNVWRNT